MQNPLACPVNKGEKRKHQKDITYKKDISKVKIKIPIKIKIKIVIEIEIENKIDNRKMNVPSLQPEAAWVSMMFRPDYIYLDVLFYFDLILDYFIL